MLNPRCVVSDMHFHGWSQFAKPSADGINSRLRIAIDELERAADTLLKAGGTRMIIAGDTFHVRGSIDPEVFNPVHEAFCRILARGVSIEAIVGNHDLKGKETTELGNAIQTLGALEGFTVITEICVRQGIVFVPWISSADGVRAAVDAIASSLTSTGDFDLILHTGINGVLIDVPDHGLSIEEIAKWGFKRVMSGHYHHHKYLENGIYSIGALVPQTWSDVAAKAGFLIVDDESVRWNASRAPSFVDIDENTDPEEIPLIVDGNYVRIRGLKMTNEQIKQMGEELRAMGAAGVSFQVAREVISARTGSAPAKITSLEASIAKYINDTIGDPAVIDACREIMTAVTTVAS